MSSLRPGRPHVVAVTGVTGKTGRQVADLAMARGWTVRSLSRSRPPVGAWHPMDWDDEASWEPAFAGADVAYVLIPFNHPGAAQRTPQVLRAAAAAGVSRVVLLSSFDAATAVAEDPLRRAEDALLDLPVESTILRPTWFLDNFTVGSFGSMVRAGELRLPAADGRIPFVAVSDIAAVATEAMRRDGPTGILPLTGPAAVSHADVCAAFSETWGATISYTTVSSEEFISLMALRGFDAEYCAFLIDALGDVDRGVLDIPVSRAVQDVTGAAPLDIHEFAARNRDWFLSTGRER